MNQTINDPTPQEVIDKLIENAKDELEFAPQEYIPGPEPKERSIYKKIAQVMGQMDRIPKSGYNKTHDYHYATESDIVGACRPLMAETGLVMTPSIKRYKVDKVATRNSSLYIGETVIEWEVRDVDSYEVIKFTMIGKGADMLEKDIYKSVTGNKKYALIVLFLIDSGDDPERNDTPNMDNGNSNRQNRGQNQRQGNSNGRGRNNSQSAQNGNKGVSQETLNAEVNQLKKLWKDLSDGEGVTEEDMRKSFDTWYGKKKAENWTHLNMNDALVKRLKEKRQAQELNTKNVDGLTDEERQALGKQKDQAKAEPKEEPKEEPKDEKGAETHAEQKASTQSTELPFDE